MACAGAAQATTPVTILGRRHVHLRCPTNFHILFLGLHTMGNGGTFLGGFGTLQLGKPVSLKDRREEHLV
jgi:hypothetical protein